MDQLLTILNNPIPALILFAAAQIADVMTTNRAIESGRGAEGNPIMAFLMSKLGAEWWVAKLVVMACAAATLWQIDWVIWIWPITILTAFIAWRNYRIGSS